MKNGEIVKLEWHLLQGDIDFRARFVDVFGNETEVVKVDRAPSYSLEYIAPERGVLSLYYDNSFSWLRKKVLEGKVILSHACCVCEKSLKGGSNSRPFAY